MNEYSLAKVQSFNFFNPCIIAAPYQGALNVKIFS